VIVGFHAGQLLQPVPGGIGRYCEAVLAHLDAPDLGVVAFAAGPRPERVAARVPWIDLGAPRGSARYELWHRNRRSGPALDVDVVHAPSLAIPPARDVPLIVTVHDVAFLRLPHVTTERGRRFHRRGLELARDEAALVVAPSEFTRAELEREGFGPDRIVVIPHGVDAPAPITDDEAAARRGALRIDQPYVLTVGTVEPRKDLPTLVRAVGRLHRAHPDLQLVIAGPPGWGEVAGIDRPFVRAVGWQPQPVLDALYHGAQAFCISSLYEGFGLPALEAMVRGVPTVATTGSAPEEFVRDAGVLFPPGDSAACAAALEPLVADPAARESCARLGETRARELTWRRSADELARTYRRLAAQRGS